MSDAPARALPRLGWIEAAALAALAALQSLAYADGALWPLQWLAIAALAWRVQRATPARAAALGAVYGTAWVAASVWWLYISMHRYGGLPSWMAALAVLLLAAGLSAWLALAMTAFARARRGRPASDAVRFGVAWGAAELARGLVFTGFPWAATGYAQVDGPLAPLAPWIGVYGIGALTACIAALAAACAEAALGPEPSARRRALAGLGALAAGVAAVGFGPPVDFTRASGTLSVTLLQPDVPQEEKFAAEHIPETLRWVGDALLRAGGDLVVAPETAVPLLPGQLDELAPGYWPGLRAHFAQPGAPAALIGVPLGDPTAGYTNSVAGLGTGPPYRYDKVHLVPFGEFIPPMARWFTDMMNIPLGDFRRGDPAAAAFVLRGQRVLPNICFEDLFGEELAAHFDGSESTPTVLVNLSNIGWFGDSPAPRQHLAISRMRSLELQRPMLRATNTGATAIIDHHGRVLAALPYFTRGVLTGQVQGRKGRTPYALAVGATGLWPWLALAWLALAMSMRRARRAPADGKRGVAR